MFMRSALKFLFLAVIYIVSAEHAFSQGPAAFSDPGARSGSGAVTGDGIVPVLPSVDGGAVPIGSTAQVVIRFRNEGAQPVETGLIRLYPSSNVSATISLNQCQEGALNSGAECAIALSVKGLQAGAWRVEMLMSHNGRSRLVSATLSGNVEASAEGADRLASDIEAIPNEIDFETLNASQDMVEPVILRNITSNPIKIESIAVDGSLNSGFTHSAQCEVLQPGQACLATVRWSPKLNGPSSGVLVVRHDGPTGLASVPLKGEYTPDEVEQAEPFPQAVPGRGLLVASQTEIDFGTDIDTVSTITVSLVNAGDSAMTLNDISIAGSDNGLTIKSGGCSSGMVLDPIEACPLTVSWSPTRIGNLLDDIQVTHTGARGVLVLPVRGTSIGTVSQDQGAIMLSGGLQSMGAIPNPPRPGEMDAYLDDPSLDNINDSTAMRSPTSFMPSVSNPASVLDGLKITSFSPTRAIVAGPGGSRIVFHNEEVVLGGVPWDVHIQRNGIEFTNQGNTILLLFDRSLSPMNRVQAGTASSDAAAGSATGAAAPPVTP